MVLGQKSSSPNMCSDIEVSHLDDFIMWDISLCIKHFTVIASEWIVIATVDLQMATTKKYFDNRNIIIFLLFYGRQGKSIFN